MADTSKAPTAAQQLRLLYIEVQAVQSSLLRQIEQRLPVGARSVEPLTPYDTDDTALVLMPSGKRLAAIEQRLAALMVCSSNTEDALPLLTPAERQQAERVCNGIAVLRGGLLRQAAAMAARLAPL
jgi:hypothetical protein